MHDIDQNDATYEAVMATIKQLYGDVTEVDDEYSKVQELRQSIAKIFGKADEKPEEEK